MTEVKSVIYHLCKVFNGLFSSEIIKPEHFRYSKFDGTSDEVVPALWKLLHNLCCSTTQKDMRCDAADIVSCVKLAFARMRYSCVSLFKLPTNMKVGSRELLLALAWLLATDRLQQLIQKFVSKSLLQHEYPSYSAGEELGAFESINLKSEEDIINFINWVSGRVKTNIAYIRNLSRELITHTSRVHCATLGAFGVAHLSVQNVLLLKEHALITERMLEDCSHTIIVLQNYLLWTKKQNSFWNWMESVMEEEERQK